MATRTTAKTTVAQAAEQLANQPKPAPVKLSSVAFSYAVALLERGADKVFVEAHKLGGGKHNGALNELSKKTYGGNAIAARRGNGGKGQAAKLGQIRLFVTRDQIKLSERKKGEPDSRPAGGSRTTPEPIRTVSVAAIRSMLDDLEKKIAERRKASAKSVDDRLKAAAANFAKVSADDLNGLNNANVEMTNALKAKAELEDTVLTEAVMALRADYNHTEHEANVDWILRRIGPTTKTA